MTIQEVEKAFDRFFESKTQKVLFLKGPWGSGKSFFVRDYLTKSKPFIPSYQYFASLFGLSTLEQVRETINASLHIRPSVGGLGIFSVFNGWIGAGKAIKVLTKIPKVYGVPVGSIGSSLFWFVARMQRSVIVFDDLERAKVPSHEVLGLASSLAENSQAKIVVIFNEEKLPGVSQEKLQEYREKVVDVELLFRPSNTELVKKFLKRQDIGSEVGAILDSLKATNIRLINKINEHLDQFEKLVATHRITPSSEELVHVAKIVCLHYVGRRKVTPDMVASGLFGLFSERTEDSQEDKEFSELVKNLGLFPALPLDGLALELIQNGFCPQETQKTYLDRYRDNRERSDLINDTQRAYDRYLNNFQGTIEEVYADMESFLDKYADRVATDQFRANIDFLRKLNYKKNTERWIALHLGVINLYPRVQDRIAAATSLLPSIAVEVYLKGLHAESKKPINPTEMISRIIKNSSWHPDDCAALNAMSEDEIFTWMSSDSSVRFIGLLREITKIWGNHSDDAKSFCLKVQGVAKRMAADSFLNEQRVANVLGVTLDSESPSQGE